MLWGISTASGVLLELFMKCCHLSTVCFSGIHFESCLKCLMIQPLFVTFFATILLNSLLRQDIKHIGL